MKKIFLSMLCAGVIFSCGKSETDNDNNGNGNNNGNQTEEPQKPQPAPEEPDPEPEPEPEPEPSDTPYFSNGFMKGSTMCFASYEQDLGLVYRENGEEKDPYASMKEHGANIVRLQLNFEDFSQYTECNGAAIDWATWDRVLADAKRAKANGLDIMLTLKPDADIYHEKADTEHNRVPVAWRSLNETQMGDELYKWVYGSLENLAKEGIFPRVVAVGNEVNVEFLAPVTGYKWDTERHARLLKRGFQAVRDYAAKYDPNVKSLLHIAGPSEIGWYVGSDMQKYGCTDFDVVGVSWYPGEGIGHKMGDGAYSKFSGIVNILKNIGYEFMILETSYTAIHGRGDDCNNSYNDPAWGSQNAANTSPARQREWLRSLAAEVKDGGGIGVITWGTESLPDDGTGVLYTYPVESWAHGSTWENNSYWDFTDNNNLHEGIDWMLDVAE